MIETIVLAILFPAGCLLGYLAGLSDGARRASAIKSVVQS